MPAGKKLFTGAAQNKCSCNKFATLPGKHLRYYFLRKLKILSLQLIYKKNSVRNPCWDFDFVFFFFFLKYLYFREFLDKITDGSSNILQRIIFIIYSTISHIIFENCKLFKEMSPQYIAIHDFKNLSRTPIHKVYHTITLGIKVLQHNSSKKRSKLSFCPHTGKLPSGSYQ